MRHLFIINPVAGKGRAMKVIPHIKKLFEERGDEYIIEMTKYASHATEIARRYTSSGNDETRIYSVGGDGTLNEVLNGMAESGCSLGCVPYGSGNDFIRSLYHVNGTEDIPGTLKSIVDGSEKTVDLARVNGRYFLNIASVGFDAEVVYNAQKMKRIPLVTGSMAYVLGIFATWLNFKHHYLNIAIDGARFRIKSLLTAVANGRYYGGGIQPVPDAVINDGFFDACIVGEMNRLKILRFLPMYMKGKHTEGIAGVSFKRGCSVQIKCEEEITLNIDGEIQRVKEANFDMIPGGLRFIVPDGVQNVAFAENANSFQTDGGKVSASGTAAIGPAAAGAAVAGTAADKGV